MDEGANPPGFDEHLARRLIAKRVIVGMTYLSNDGAFLEQKQFHGTVAVADARKGISITAERRRGSPLVTARSARLSGSAQRAIPPSLDG